MASEAPKPKVRKPSLGKERAQDRAKPDAPRRKLTFADQHALKTLPTRIAELERDIAALHAKLSDGELYMRDPKAFAAASEKLVAAQAALASAEERWLELEMLREELERQ